MPQLTPSQTIGPFYWGTVVKAYRADLAPPGVAGERIEVALVLHDVQGAIVPDGLFEIWQANSHGRYNHPEDRRNLPLDAGFDGYGRASTDTAGCARFSSVKPGRVPWPQGGMQAPHISLSIFARGLLNRVATRLSRPRAKIEMLMCGACMPPAGHGTRPGFTVANLAHPSVKVEARP